MTRIPADILDIAAVVTGGEQLPLAGWQRADAIRAMHALGWRAERIQHALCLKRRWHLNRLARDVGVDLTARDDQPDLLAVDFVRAGARMPLRGVDRDAAIEALARDRKSVPEIAFRLCLSYAAASKAADRLGVHTISSRDQPTARPVSVAA